jgi:hypothetical protein
MNTRSKLITDLLLQLHTVHPKALRICDLHTGALAMGHPNETLASISSVLDDMQEQRFITMKRDDLDASVKRYKRTEEGRVILIDNGLI